jgi:hypothetical protein
MNHHTADPAGPDYQHLAHERSPFLVTVQQRLICFVIDLLMCNSTLRRPLSRIWGTAEQLRSVVFSLSGSERDSSPLLCHASGPRRKKPNLAGSLYLNPFAFAPTGPDEHQKNSSAAITTAAAHRFDLCDGLVTFFHFCACILVDKAKRKVYILPRHKEKGR